MKRMIDKNLRTVNYLRISVTDMCNLRCIYCRPKEGLSLFERKEILTFEEICSIVRYSVNLGIHKFRLTGGEPLARKGIESLVRCMAGVSGVEDLAMTTNGILLKKYAVELKNAGLSRINISLDTLNAEKYSKITRGGSLEAVFSGIEEAKKVGFKNLKINVVIMAGVNDDEIEEFAQLTIDKNIEVRFIELMATRNKKKLKGASFFPVDMVVERIKRQWETEPLLAKSGNGPAKRFRIIGSKGSLGFINAVSNPFCSNCNRLRLTSDGKLRSCLLKNGKVDIKPIIREQKASIANRRIEFSDHQKEELCEAFYKVINMKPKAHEGSSDVVMSQVGG